MLFFAAMFIAVSGAAIQMDEKSCSAPRERGDFCAQGSQKQMFYYNSAQGICQPFMYNGCNGNGNRFATKEECTSFCANGGAQRMRDAPQSQTTSNLAAMTAACNAEYDTQSVPVVQCTSNQQCGGNSTCTNGYCCLQNNHICNLRYDSGKFSQGGEKSDRYFYTDEYKTCMRFSFYGTLGNANNFPNYNACMRACGGQQ